VQMKVFPTLALCVVLAGCNVVANLDAVSTVKQAPIQRYDQFQEVASNGKLLVSVGSQGVIVSSDNGGTSWKRTVPAGNFLPDRYRGLSRRFMGGAGLLSQGLGG
jgi:photosystem II stability/assembly factor-like uncharacterized protein